MWLRKSCKAVDGMGGKWKEYSRKILLEKYDDYQNEVDRYNSSMLKFFNLLVLIMLFLMFISGFFTGYVADMMPVYAATAAITVLEIIADRIVFFKAGNGMDSAVFLCMTKIYAFCIISGVSYSQKMPAISFFIFMIVLSILFIVRPWKLNLFNFCAGIAFCLSSYVQKPPSVALADIYDCWAFYIVAAAVSFWIVKLRVGFIRNEKLLTIQRDTDILTTLPNRRRFNIYAGEAFEDHKDKQLSILMMDIDHFKAYNDTKGHIAGDYCLESIGKALRRFGEERGIFFARYGGEEFVAVDTQHGRDELEEIAGEIVRTVYELGLPHESSSFRRITISVGYACQADAGAGDYIKLLECADKALYLAKQQGRNQIAGYGSRER